MTTLPDRVTAFSWRRQRLAGDAPTAIDAVRAAVGVYSAQPSGPLSIRARAAKATPEDVRALERNRAAVRMRAMRTSAFLVPRETAPIVAAATAVPAERFAWKLREAGVSREAVPALREVLTAAALVPTTVAEIRRAAGRALDGVRLPPLLSYFVLDGSLLAVGPASLSATTWRYVAAAAWLGRPLVGPSPGATAQAAQPAESVAAGAREWLAGAYLQAFGPARAADLAWWSGMGTERAQAALAAHDTVDLGGGLLLHAGDLAAFESLPDLADGVVLVPKWDAWTMGYPQAGRTRFVDHAEHDRVFDGDGNALGMVLVRGRAIGGWAHRAQGPTMEADLDLFEPPAERLRDSIEGELAAIAAFLGYGGLRIRDVASIVPQRLRIRRLSVALG